MEQLVEVSQTRAVADALLRLRAGLAARGGRWAGRPLAEVLAGLEAEMDEQVRDGTRVPNRLCVGRELLVFVGEHVRGGCLERRHAAGWRDRERESPSKLAPTFSRLLCRVWMRWRGAPSPATWRARGALSWRRRSTACAARCCGS